jgi:hypothetical protein
MGSDALVARMPVVQGLTVPKLNAFGGDRYLPDIPKEWFILPIRLFSVFLSPIHKIIFNSENVIKIFPIAFKIMTPIKKYWFNGI